MDESYHLNINILYSNECLILRFKKVIKDQQTDR